MNSKRSVVYVVDDDVSMRRGLSRLIKSSGLHVEAFEDPKTFIEAKHDNTAPACLILDMMMPNLSGLDVQAKLKSMSSLIPIIFITGHGTVPNSVQALKEGAVDFIEKPFEDEVLLSAIHVALSHHKDVLAREEELAETQQHFADLTGREQEVMLLVVKGFPNKEIADFLKISEKTVKVHRARVMSKMKSDSLADLVRTSERAGL